MRNQENILILNVEELKADVDKLNGERYRVIDINYHDILWNVMNKVYVHKGQDIYSVQRVKVYNITFMFATAASELGLFFKYRGYSKGELEGDNPIFIYYKDFDTECDMIAFYGVSTLWKDIKKCTRRDKRVQLFESCMHTNVKLIYKIKSGGGVQNFSIANKSKSFLFSYQKSKTDIDRLPVYEFSYRDFEGVSDNISLRLQVSI